MAWGRSLLTTNIVLPTRVSADGVPVYKAGGITIDWASVAAPGSDVTLRDGGSIIRAGNKFLGYGQVVCKETTTGSVQTLTNGSGTGGTFTLTFTRPDTGNPVTTAAIAWNATAATILAAIQAVMGPGQALTATGGPISTTPVPVTFATAVLLGTVNGAGITGGTAPTIALTAAGLLGGFFGPYDPGASDGRQNLNRGDCFILDETVVQYPAGGPSLGPSTDQTGGAIEGGHLYVDRIMHSGTAAHTLALGPTLAEITTAFPRASFVRD